MSEVDKIQTFDEFIAEGTWALSKSFEKRQEEGAIWIQKIKDFKEAIYNIFGDDLLFDHFDGAIRRIKELMVLLEDEISENLNEDVDIPASLSTRYVAVKKQLADKQTQKDQLLKQINQKDLEMNILQKNINAIEAQAADLQGQAAKTAQPPATGATPAAGQATPATTPAKESVTDIYQGILLEDIVEWDELDEKLFGKKPDPIKPFLDAMNDLNPEEETKHPEDTEEDFGLGDTKFGTDIDRFNESSDDDIDIVESPDEDEKDKGEVEEISPDYLFALRLNRPDDDEEIIAKVYRNEDDEFWKIRVVQGDEEPLEAMQFDPEMQMVDIIERLAEIYDEVEEVDVKDYEDLIDDKEESDEKFYGKDKTEKVKEEL